MEGTMTNKKEFTLHSKYRTQQDAEMALVNLMLDAWYTENEVLVCQTEDDLWGLFRKEKQ
jgi:hypothetical protein